MGMLQDILSVKQVRKLEHFRHKHEWRFKYHYEKPDTVLQECIICRKLRIIKNPFRR